MKRNVLIVQIEDRGTYVHAAVRPGPGWSEAGLIESEYSGTFLLGSRDPGDLVGPYRDAVEYIAYRLAAIAGANLSETAPLF